MCLNSIIVTKSDPNTFNVANQSSSTGCAQIDANSIMSLTSRCSPNVLEELISALKSPPSTPPPEKSRGIEKNTIGVDIMEQLITMNNTEMVLEHSKSAGNISDSKEKNQPPDGDANSTDGLDLRGDWISDRMADFVLKELESLYQSVRSMRAKNIGIERISSIQPGVHRDAVASSMLNDNKRRILQVIAKFKELIEG